MQYELLHFAWYRDQQSILYSKDNFWESMKEYTSLLIFLSLWYMLCTLPAFKYKGEGIVIPDTEISRWASELVIVLNYSADFSFSNARETFL